MRLLVVGWDSADWSVLHPLAEAGHLPTLRSLLLQGVHGSLRSTLPALTPPAWTTLATGVNPGRHGIFNFWRRLPDSYRYEVVTRRHRRTRAVWDWLNEQGLTVGLLHYPITFPPEPLHGFCVSGWYVPPGQAFTYPAEARRWLEEDGPYQVHRLDGGVMAAAPEAYLERLCEAAERQTEAALCLARARPVDVLWTVYLMTDWAQHFLWEPGVPASGNAALRKLYRTMDRCLARLLDEQAPERVVLLSDHGAGPVEGVLHLNSLLEELGFLSARPGRRLDAGSEPAWRRHPLVMALRRLKGRLSQRAGRFPDLADQIDVTRSRAYALGTDGAIFLNLRGREPAGVVEPGEGYQQVRAELAQALLEVRHPETGEPLVEVVHPREAIYHGAALHQAPDLLLVTREHRFSARGGFGRRWCTPPDQRAADHRRLGVWLAVAPECPANAQGGTLEAVDLAPTLLALLQAPQPEGLDGQVHGGLLRQDWLACHPPATAPARWDREENGSSGLAREEEEEIARHLRDLGYLE